MNGTLFFRHQSAARRSPASAPLLDSLKDRKTRDAVKSVIDRITGARKAPAEPASQPQAVAPAPAAGTPAPANADTAPVPEASAPPANTGQSPDKAD